ncbi:MAG: carboxypeptidase regulatory-like domain-containing protein, partial [Acidobacteria bacterium]|nr:carboxypeptidase regulatory-like domain-containing protein [Acidobacteriota bacterium]
MSRILLLIILAVPLFAQTKGTISGYVKDRTGAVVPNTNITVTHEGTRAVRTTTSDGIGFYQVL